jgi:hypothetical protein
MKTKRITSKKLTYTEKFNQFGYKNKLIIEDENGGIIAEFSYNMVGYVQCFYLTNDNGVRADFKERAAITVFNAFKKNVKEGFVNIIRFDDYQSELKEQRNQHLQKSIADKAQSRKDTEVLNQAFEQREQEALAKLPEDERNEIIIQNRLQAIFAAQNNGDTVTDDDIDFVNEHAFLPKGAKFTADGLRSLPSIKTCLTYLNNL